MFRGSLFSLMAFLSLSRSKKLVRVILLYVPSLEYLYPTESDFTECQIKAVNKDLLWTIEEPLDPRGPVSPLSSSPRRVADQRQPPPVSGGSLARRRKTNTTLRYLSCCHWSRLSDCSLFSQIRSPDARRRELRVQGELFSTAWGHTSIFSVRWVLRSQEIGHVYHEGVSYISHWLYHYLRNKSRALIWNRSTRCLVSSNCIIMAV